MTCREVAPNAWVCSPGPMETLREDREPPRWCFGCRKRLGGTHRLRGETGPTYYDPHWTYACDGCGQDRRWGFGCGPL